MKELRSDEVLIYITGHNHFGVVLTSAKRFKICWVKDLFSEQRRGDDLGLN